MAQLVGKAPEMRFQGFQRNWQIEPLLSRIKKIIDFRGRTPKKLGLEWSESGYLALSALNVKDGYIDRSSDAHFGDDELYNTWMQGNDLHQNQVLFTTEAPMGNVAQVPDSQRYILSQRTIAFVTDTSSLSEDFLAVLLKSPTVARDLQARASGGTAKGVSQKSLASVVVALADDLSEQEHIGSYFKSLDRMIGLHQRKHDKLVTLKQAMLQKMFPQDGATTPEIRFKGFEGDWTERKLGDATLPISSNTLSRADLNYKSGPAKNIHYGDILVRFGEVLNANRSDVPFITSHDTNDGLKSLRLQDGDIIIADAAEDEAVGKCTELFNVGDTAVVAGLHTIATRPTMPFAAFYLGYFMNSHSYHDQLLPLMQGTKVLSVSRRTLHDTILRFPRDTKEQQNIGSYFYKLDHLISKHATQLEKLKNIKSACLEKMFV